MMAYACLGLSLAKGGGQRHTFCGPPQFGLAFGQILTFRFQYGLRFAVKLEPRRGLYGKVNVRLEGKSACTIAGLLAREFLYRCWRHL